MKKIKIILLSIIALCGIIFIVTLNTTKINTPLHSTLNPAFQLIGRPVQTMNMGLSKIIPVNELDEKEYGEAIALYYEDLKKYNPKETRYVDTILKRLTYTTKKDFKYQGYMIEDDAPNAMALPGGNIFVTTGLLSTLQSESELAAVLSHEIGHIELGHTFQLVRFELLGRKLGEATMGQLIDQAMSLLLMHTYSKNDESDADKYAYTLIENSEYDPYALSLSFKSLQRYSSENTKEKKANVWRDYFSSHPEPENRAEKYRMLAIRYWINNEGVERYRGKRNLKKLVSLTDKSWDNEWVSSLTEPDLK